MMRERVYELLSDYCGIEDHSRIIAAVSAGPDSMCLLHLLSGMPFEVIVAHLNHQLRPSAAQEQAYVEMKAGEYHLPFFSENADIKKYSNRENLGIEEAARRARYEFLFRIAKENQSAALLTAHHADDQVETVLMNFIRGAGLKGLSGMQHVSFSPFGGPIPLIRPLLEYWKEEILEYCQKNNLIYFVDESNLNLEYFRNRIRNHLLPGLAEYNPNIKQTILRSQKNLTADWQYISEEANKILPTLDIVNNEKYISFSMSKFALIPNALKNYVLREMVLSINSEKTDFSFDQVEKVKELLSKNERMRTVQLEKDLVLLMEGGRGIFAQSPEYVWDDKWPVIEEGRVIHLDESLVILNDRWTLDLAILSMSDVQDAFKSNTDPFTAYLDRGCFEESLRLRHWKFSDYYQPLGMNGHKVRLSDFWTNHKIPARAKEKWPLVISNGQIVWIPGFQPSHGFSLKDSTTSILALKLRRSG